MTRWFLRRDLNDRLYIAFTIFFVISIAILANLLQTVSAAINYNTRLRGVFEHTRISYQAQAMIQQMEKALNYMEINGDPDHEVSFAAASSLLEDLLQLAMLEPYSDEELVILQRLQDLHMQFVADFGQIVLAVDAGDNEQVAALDGKLYEEGGVILTLYDDIDALNELGLEAMAEVEKQVEAFQTRVMLSILIALPVFLVAVLLTAVVMQTQLNDPIQELITSVQEVKAGTFDPKKLTDMASYQDELGAAAREFLLMYENLGGRAEKYAAEAEDLRSRIR